MAERPLLQVVGIKDVGENNAIGINDSQALITDPFDAPRRRKPVFLVA
jgi:hypothetical protein